jgi:hypothetical protein
MTAKFVDKDNERLACLSGKFYTPALLEVSVKRNNKKAGAWYSGRLLLIYG